MIFIAKNAYLQYRKWWQRACRRFQWMKDSNLRSTESLRWTFDLQMARKCWKYGNSWYLGFSKMDIEIEHHKNTNFQMELTSWCIAFRSWKSCSDRLPECSHSPLNCHTLLCSDNANFKFSKIINVHTLVWTIELPKISTDNWARSSRWNKVHTHLKIIN